MTESQTENTYQGDAQAWYEFLYIGTNIWFLTNWLVELFETSPSKYIEQFMMHLDSIYLQAFTF